VQTIEAGVHLTVAGHGARRTVNRTGNGNLFNLNGTDRSLTLGDNITLAGHEGNTVALVNVVGGASLTMNAGAWITGNTASQTFQGGGVHISGAGSTFTMNGGEIHGNSATAAASGGGVCIGPNSAFAMHTGAVIRGNTDTGGSSAGGVNLAGTLTMHGGVIKGNTGGYGLARAPPRVSPSAVPSGL